MRTLPPPRDATAVDDDRGPRLAGILNWSATLGSANAQVMRVRDACLCDHLEVFSRDELSIVLITQSAGPVGNANIERRRAGRWRGRDTAMAIWGSTAPGEGAVPRWRNRTEHTRMQIRLRAWSLEGVADGLGCVVPAAPFRAR